MELIATIRGSERRVRWRDGVLSGDDEVVRRLDRVIASGTVDASDLVSVLNGVELVTAQHVDVVELDVARPEPVPEAHRRLEPSPG